MTKVAFSLRVWENNVPTALFEIEKISGGFRATRLDGKNKVQIEKVKTMDIILAECFKQFGAFNESHTVSLGIRPQSENQAEQNEKIIKVGDIIDGKIEAVGVKGDGFIKVQGLVVFIPKTKAGQEVKVKITKVTSRSAFGEVVE